MKHGNEKQVGIAISFLPTSPGTITPNLGGGVGEKNDEELLQAFQPGHDNGIFWVMALGSTCFKELPYGLKG